MSRLPARGETGVVGGREVPDVEAAHPGAMGVVVGVGGIVKGAVVAGEGVRRAVAAGALRAMTGMSAASPPSASCRKRAWR
jgi:hypothetical protein